MGGETRTDGRRRSVRTVMLLAAVATLVAAAPATAGPGLPRTYSVQRIDGPAPGVMRTFGFIFVNGGDLGGGPGGARDGKEDLLVPQGTALVADGNGAEQGEIVVVSGADGSTIRRIPAPDPDTDGGGLGAADRRSAFGTYVGKLADIGSCPSFTGSPGQTCATGSIGGKDGLPEIIASATHVDVPTPGSADGGRDIGRVYVIDGATGGVLKRIDMPEADRIDQDTRVEQLGSNAPAPVRPVFGRTVISPAGLPPCDGNAGLGPCPPASGAGSVPRAVRIGDLNGGGEPDIVVGASFVQDDDQTNPACESVTPAVDACDRSGRTYVYFGEAIAGSDPSNVDSTPDRRILNPFAQADDPNPTIITELELFGHAVAPVGDVGTCGTSPGLAQQCPSRQITQAPDGKPEVLVSDFRVDYPLDDPDPDKFDIGVNLLLDGATGALLHTYHHPEPQASSIFGFTLVNQPAFGDLGRTSLPDVYLPAAGQNVQFRGQGKGYVVNGARAAPNDITMATLNDPTPQASGNFGTSSAGVGDLIGDSRNELLVGEFGSHNPAQNPDVIGDAHIFDPLSERALQTIPDPDQQKVSEFGSGVAPLGDVNDDGFLDLAVGAGRYSGEGGRDQGRLYIFRSDNSEPPSPSATPSAPRALVAGRCANAFRGTERDDTIAGTIAGDRIDALGGHDRVDGLQGDDCLSGARGRDRLAGALGNDRLSGGADRDSLSGGGGVDSLSGGAAKDKLNGGGNRDSLSGGSGPDQLSGASDNDRLTGGSGNDRLAGGSGRNRYSAGAGNDRVLAANGHNERINCGSGRRDVALADRGDRLRGCERVRRLR